MNEKKTIVGSSIFVVLAITVNPNTREALSWGKCGGYSVWGIA
jgi:hypothetical protein